MDTEKLETFKEEIEVTKRGNQNPYIEE